MDDKTIAELVNALDKTRALDSSEDPEVSFKKHSEDFCLHVTIPDESIHEIIENDFTSGCLVSRICTTYSSEVVVSFIISMLVYQRHLGQERYSTLLKKLFDFIEYDLENIDSIKNPITGRKLRRQ